MAGVEGPILPRVPSAGRGASGAELWSGRILRSHPGDILLLALKPALLWPCILKPPTHTKVPPERVYLLLPRAPRSTSIMIGPLRCPLGSMV